MTHSDSSAGAALASQRYLFEIPHDVAFLNCAYISPLPKVSLSAGDRGLRRKAQPWTIAAADFFTSSETVRKLFADLINADADDVALLQRCPTAWRRRRTTFRSEGRSAS